MSPEFMSDINQLAFSPSLFVLQSSVLIHLHGQHGGLGI